MQYVWQAVIKQQLLQPTGNVTVREFIKQIVHSVESVLMLIDTIEKKILEDIFAEDIKFILAEISTLFHTETDFVSCE